jgi:hypothetical protein
MLRIHFAVGIALLATAASGATPPKEHPLLPVLRMAYEGYVRMDSEVNDYTCTLTKRERVDGRLLRHTCMQLKVRHQRVADGHVVKPFSVYIRFLSPEKVQGCEVLYVHGRNDGKMIVRRGGMRFGYITTSIPLDSPVAFQFNRYPITEIGVKNLTRRLMENGQDELQYDDVNVKIVPGAKVNHRPCTLIQVSHPMRREGMAYRFARILVDDELHLPVHYSAYDWPKEEGGDSRLIEEYTYTDIKMNVGLTDWDFDHRNERYLFLKTFNP